MDYKARMYDPALGRFLQPDSIIPGMGNPQNLNRFSYVGNSPTGFNDPTGHWLETALDVAFIAYDLVSISQEGWTPLNTGALVLDVECAALPIATGGGPALRLATAGGEVAAKAAVKIPTIIRIGQGIEKLGQFVAANGKTPDTIRGREAHKNYESALGEGYEFNKGLPSGNRPDAINWKDKIVRELKPDTSTAIAKGWSQIRKYLNELAEITGDNWTGFVHT